MAIDYSDGCAVRPGPGPIGSLYPLWAIKEFPSIDEAVRFAVEVLPQANQAGCVIASKFGHMTWQEIRERYRKLPPSGWQKLPRQSRSRQNKSEQ